MPANLEVNPADIKFTQDSISLYFQYPYEKFSVREAVIKLSKDAMRPDEFPRIRVNSYGGCLWSIDNRRLWVFRLARCSSINVELVKKMHLRVQNVVSNKHLYSMMQAEDFFPRVRDKGIKDLKFDQQFPQPVSSLQLPVYVALEKPPINVAQVSNVDTEIARTFAMPAEQSINPVEEHEYGQSYTWKWDLRFDQRFPQPVSSVQLPVDVALEKPPINVAEVSNVDTEISRAIAMPAKPSINPVEEHKYGQSGTGKRDLTFDQQFPQPVSSLQVAVDEALEKPLINVAQVSNVDTEISGPISMPAKPFMNPVEEHEYGQIEINIVPDQESGSTGSTKPSMNPVEEHEYEKIEIIIVPDQESGSTGPTKPSIHPMEDLARRITDAVGRFFSNIFAEARKIGNVVGSVFKF